MSNPSKAKGTRGEYKVRDILRSLGYKADRVPCSGAAQGFKGDIKAHKDGVEYLIEVKCRESLFKSVYEFYDGISIFGLLLHFQDREIWVSTHFEAVAKNMSLIDCVPPNRVGKKILTMEKWLGEAQILTIIGDRKPPIFIRFDDEKDTLSLA